MNVRQQLAAMMEREFIVERYDGPWYLKVDHEKIWVNRHHARAHDDTVGAFGGEAIAVNPAGTELVVMFGSYDTMTMCVKHGIVFSWRSRLSEPFTAGLDVIAKETKTQAEHG